MSGTIRKQGPLWSAGMTLRGAVNSTNALAVKTFGEMGFRFASNLILTRLLVPEAFGVVLLISSISYVFVMLTETGIPAFVIRAPNGLQKRYMDTLWTIQVLRGCALTIVLFLLAEPIATLLDKPELGGVLQVTSLLFLLRDLRSMSVSRERRLRRDYYNSIVELGVSIMTTVITIGLAVWLRTYWALVFGTLIAAAITTAMSYAAYRDPWHRPRLDWDVAKELWLFSRFIAASSILTLVINQFDKFVVLSDMPLDTAGLYNMALTLTAVAGGFVMLHARRIHIAEVAHVVNTGTPGPDMHYRPLRFVKPLLLFACAGGITFGEAFFDILFDPRYLAAGTYFSILVIGPLLSLYSRHGEQTMVALNQPRTTFVSDILRLIWLPIGPLAGYRLFGLEGLLFGVALIELLPAIYFTVLLVRERLFDAKRELQFALAIPAGLLVGAAASQGWTMLSGA